MTFSVEIDLEEMLRTLAGGGTQRSIAAKYGIDPGNLSRWIVADEQRSARVKLARTLGATYWDEQAESGISDASDPFALAKAKELAHHYRWRASKIAPDPYGDKVALDVRTEAKRPDDLTDAELAAIATGRAIQKADTSTRVSADDTESGKVPENTG